MRRYIYNAPNVIKVITSWRIN